MFPFQGNLIIFKPKPKPKAGTKIQQNPGNPGTAKSFKKHIH